MGVLAAPAAAQVATPPLADGAVYKRQLGTNNPGWSVSYDGGKTYVRTITNAEYLRRTGIAREVLRALDQTSSSPTSGAAQTIADRLDATPNTARKRRVLRGLRSINWRAGVAAGSRGFGVLSLGVAAGQVGYYVGGNLNKWFGITVPANEPAAQGGGTQTVTLQARDKGEHMASTPAGDITAPADGWSLVYHIDNLSFTVLENVDDAGVECPKPTQADVRPSPMSGGGTADVIRVPALMPDGQPGFKFNCFSPVRDGKKSVWMDFIALAPEHKRREGARVQGSGNARSNPADTTRDAAIDTAATAPNGLDEAAAREWIDAQPEVADEGAQDPTLNVMPDCHGLTVAGCGLALEEAGIQATLHTELLTDATLDLSVGPNRISRTQPSAGSTVAPGTAVDITVLLNPATAPPPGGGAGGGGAPPPGCDRPPIRDFEAPAATVPRTFPFGIPFWIADALAAFVVTATAPDFSITLPGGLPPLHVNLAWTEGALNITRPVVLVCAAIAMLVSLANLLGRFWIDRAATARAGG